MANIIPPLVSAVKALDAVKRHPEVSAEDKVAAAKLIETLRGRIQVYKVEAPALKTLQAYKVRQHATEIDIAIKTYDFGTAVSRGAALVDALPGPGQSRRKWPRRPR
jgi:hypothetical protein